MTGDEIRERFLKYFEDRGHTRVDSSPLVPQDDPTLLFTNAGMVQFKRVFMGEDKRSYVRATTSQRCVRAGGKHNDLENVGYTARHHTFFEMLGNFSFGDYFKKEAITFAWDFLTKELGLDPAQLWVSIYTDDDEAEKLWKQIKDLPPGRIVRFGEKDNFWAMGDTGPCGPCSEIHIDQGAAAGCGRPDCQLGCECDRFLELWNLVFMQFYRDESGTMTPLPRPAIDTGMGLERVAAVLQGKYNNFDSDLFAPIIRYIGNLAGRTYLANRADDVAMRVIADHARATTFLVADGVLPANEGRGYVLRRIMRRAIRYGRHLGLDAFFTSVCDRVLAMMMEAYPYLDGYRNLLEKVVSNEEKRFGETLDHGLEMLHQKIETLQAAQGKQACIDGEFIFKLYDTFGFPVDIVRDIALESSVNFDQAGFAAAMGRQREQSRKSWKGADVEHLDAGVLELAGQGMTTVFLGYEDLEADSAVAGIIDVDGCLVREIKSGAEARIYCPQTPFYAEAGGQIGDRGEILWADGRFQVESTTLAAEGLILHSGRLLKGRLAVGDSVHLRVDAPCRQKIMLNHSATHLLHEALRQVLGDHVKQAGSLVEHHRLRFDFTHFSPVTEEELARTEQLVNEQVRADLRVDAEVMAREEALSNGATALFGEKYGDAVRVVTMGAFSKELCGGTHVGATGEIGLVKIVAETGIAAGVRRIEAVTGPVAVEWLQDLAARAAGVSDALSVPFEEAAARIATLLHRQKSLEREVSRLHEQVALSGLDQLLASAVEVEGIRVVAGKVPLDSAKTLREIGDKVRDRLESGIALLGGELEGKAVLLALVSTDLTGRVKAGDLVREAAAIVGGKGGGRPDMAQAGGPMPDKLDEVMARASDLVTTQLTS
ncbi:MAG: alanine--tRNA ligase [Desulfobulbus propionicus]|nr:MAG: alanine--tRNA ligase [Desulfobulbus propionicus]